MMNESRETPLPPSGHLLVKYRWWIAIVILLLLSVSAVMKTAYTPSHNTKKNTLRIVSLAPSVTEILFALGMGDSIVGVTTYCNYPPQAKTIEKIGGFGSPNVEKLLALAPDLVVAAGVERNDALDVMRNSGTHVLNFEITDFQQMFDAFLHIGSAVGKSDQARDLVCAMQAELDAVALQYQNVPHERLPRVFVELWCDPITTAGGTSFIDELVSRAGGVNVAHDLPKTYPSVNPEKVIDWNPDVIVTCYMAKSGVTASQLSNRIGWKDIAAVRNGRIIEDIPHDFILRPGPRLIEGVKALALRLREAPATNNASGGTGK